MHALTPKEITDMTTTIVTAQLHAQPMSASEVPALIANVHAAVSKLSEPAPEPVEEETYPPAVTAKKSLADPAHILSMIDGKPYTMLKRHLSQHGLTPDAYRARYGLPADYPMTAAAYSVKRRQLALASGLGKKPDPAAPAKA